VSETALPRPPQARLEIELPDKKPAMTPARALAEAERCLYCFDPPCVKACPTGIPIPDFIRKIGTGNLVGSARVILEANSLGFSCARVCPVEVLCEGDCVYNAMGRAPVEIGRLQRYATDQIYDRGVSVLTAGAPTGKRVALVGAGPASVACAAELRRLGHEAVLFEAGPYPGGLNTTGVAPYKLKVDDALREVEYLGRLGFEVRYDTAVGTDVSFAQLEADYDAVFLGVGLGGDGWLHLEGERLEGVCGALQLIERIKLHDGYRLPAIRDAVVIGAGNTAMDAVRELLALGVPHVTLVYRRDEGAMSGYEHEWAEAKKAGARALWWARPTGFVGDERVRGVRWVSSAHPAAFEGERVLEADFVALAVGQEKLAAFLDGVPGLRHDRGRVLVDEHTGQTDNPRYFAGGDCVNGGKEVVNAAAEGKRAAHGIHAFLSREG
jgi:dihydropyrimidine dehydrogenase (NAD+) subunit PreT